MRIAAFVALASLIAIALAASRTPPASSAGTDQLLPDLITLRFNPSQLFVTRRNDKIKLSFTNEIGNVGRGPLELVPGPEGADPDCDADGNPANDRVTFQRIFIDDGDGVFDRADDFRSHRAQAGCTFFHPAHDHWHFDRFARYTLRSEQTGKTVRRTKKISFCVVDTNNFRPNLLGNPDERYYTSEAGGPNPLEGCKSPDSVVGLSVGWADVYAFSLAGQSFRIDDLPAGVYCLRSEVDPANLLAEDDDSNNLHSERIRIDPQKLRASLRKGECRSA